MNNTQTQIIRQSSLKFLNDYMAQVGTPLGLYETINLAEVVTDYVTNGPTKEVNERLKRFDKFLMDETARELLDKIKEEFQIK